MNSNPTRREAIAGAGALAISVSLAGCGGDGGGDGGDGGGNGNTVDMTDQLVFDPDSLTVSVGDTVTWENTSSLGHTVTAYGDKIPEEAEYFASGDYDSEQAARDAYMSSQGGNIPAGETYEHTFEVAGTYDFFCIPHEGSMKGTITVEE
ncbi:MAG: plastocyanin/azurin family copper-binding protein [Halobacteriaceae archaeon]